MQSAAVLKQQAIADYQAKAEADSTRVADYIQQLNAMAAVLDAESAQSTTETAFLTQAHKQLSAYQLELRRVEVPFEDDGASAVLDVTINDGPPGKFILDTGASLVVLSRSFADLLKLEVNTNQTVKMTLADGQESSAHPVVLRSVECGDARTVNTPALVTDRPPGRGLDGLLGLSFLREFVLHFDAQTRRVELIRFEPAQ
jgi:clan AA aspartic protease (TIGR02281 family)